MAEIILRGKSRFLETRAPGLGGCGDHQLSGSLGNGDLMTASILSLGSAL